MRCASNSYIALENTIDGNGTLCQIGNYWHSADADIVFISVTGILRWITHDERIVQVEGEGFIETLSWETTPGYAVHLLNYTNPNAQHCWLQSAAITVA